MFALSLGSDVTNQIQEVMKNSALALKEVEGIVVGDKEQPGALPHWSVLLLGANAVISTISAIAHAILNTIAPCVVSAISAGVSIAGCATILAFTPLKSLQGYVEDLTNRIKDLTSSIRRLGATQQELTKSVDLYKKTLETQREEFDRCQLDFRENLLKLDMASKDLKLAEDKAIKLDDLIKSYSSKTDQWQKKLDSFLSASKNVSASTSDLSLHLKKLHDEDTKLSQNIDLVGEQSEVLKKNEKILGETSQNFRAAALQIAALYVAISKERDEANEKLKKLESIGQSISITAKDLKSTITDLKETEDNMNHQLDKINQVNELTELLHKANQKIKKNETNDPSTSKKKE